MKGTSDGRAPAFSAKSVEEIKANKFYNELKTVKDNKDENTVELCFNYMQNLSLPHTHIQEIFHMRKLWVNVFSVHNIETNKAKMYVYHED